MLKTPRHYIVLIGLLAFSFIYRVVLMLRETFPPGADIGLHNSIINSITASGNTDFLWNYYHMGGGSSVTFPGYHIFTSYVILLTGVPNYVAHALVVSLFSTIIVAVAFLLTRKIWNTNAAFVVAFLAAVSRFDIEMLMWGGYPNAVTLMLIPLAFYLFLQKDRFSAAPYLAVTSLVCASIFLTHSLSTALFIAITAATVFFMLVFAGKLCVRRSSIIWWIMPLVIGVIVILPFILDVAPAYLGADASAFTGGVTAIRDAILTTKLMPLTIVVPLLTFVFLYVLFSKYYQGKFLTVSTLLLVLWWLVPAVLTQGYLVGLYTDYQRFLYFVILPILMLVGLGFYHIARSFSQAFDWLLAQVSELPQVRISKNKTLHRILPKFQNRNWATLILLILVLFVFFTVPMFVSPVDGIGVQTFYQLMDQPKYAGIEWAKANTPANSVFITDAQYGWWFGGFAERPTISALSPEYMTNSREFEPATIANRILDTDYLIDNGIIQVREDGGYIGRHNPDFFAKLENNYFPYGFFTFDNTEITVDLIEQNNQYTTVLSDVPVVSQHMENCSTYASIYVTHANENFTFTTQTTVYQGASFANLTITMASLKPEVNIGKVTLTLHTTGMLIKGQNENTLAFFAPWDKVAGQLIFNESQPTLPQKIMNFDSPGTYNLQYSINSHEPARLQIFASAYEYEANPPNEYTKAQQIEWYQNIETLHAANPLEAIVDNPAPLDVFDYHQALASLNVSYIALRDPGQISRFLKDPLFDLVFINNEVAIFHVNY